MLIKGANFGCAPKNAEEGDLFIDLSNSKKYVFRCNEWVDPSVRPDLPIATADKAGVVKIGAGLSATTAGVVSVNVATTEAPGMVQVGTGLAVTEAGVVSVSSEE